MKEGYEEEERERGREGRKGLERKVVKSRTRLRLLMLTLSSYKLRQKNVDFFTISTYRWQKTRMIGMTKNYSLITASGTILLCRINWNMTANICNNLFARVRITHIFICLFIRVVYILFYRLFRISLSSVKKLVTCVFYTYFLQNVYL